MHGLAKIGGNPRDGRGRMFELQVILGRPPWLVSSPWSRAEAAPCKTIAVNHETAEDSRGPACTPSSQTAEARRSRSRSGFRQTVVRAAVGTVHDLRTCQPESAR